VPDEAGRLGEPKLEEADAGRDEDKTTERVGTRVRNAGATAAEGSGRKPPLSFSGKSSSMGERCVRMVDCLAAKLTGLHTVASRCSLQHLIDAGLFHPPVQPYRPSTPDGLNDPPCGA
jgi:hypothetical protein